MKHHRFAAVLTFAHPGGERRVEIVRVSGKPALELRDKCAAQSCIAKSHRWHDFVHRAQHRRMLIDVTFTRRKTRFTHPTIFRFEVLTKVGRKAFEVGLEVGVGAIARFRDKRFEFAVYRIHGSVAQNDWLSPHGVFVLSLHCNHTSNVSVAVRDPEQQTRIESLAALSSTLR